MNRNANICDNLPSNIINIMKKQINETKKDERERGFLICTKETMTKENTISREECFGGICGLTIRGECPPDKPIRGFYHTHPSGISLPTRDDIEYSQELNFKFLCIGTEQEIRCMMSNIPIKIIPTSELDIEEMERYKRRIENNSCVLDKK